MSSWLWRESEVISDYFTRLHSLVNKLKANGETVKEQMIVEKVLRTLPARFEHVVCAIEESKDLEHYKIEQLQGSLESHEQRMLEKHNEHGSDQALQAQYQKKNGGFDKKRFGKGKWKYEKNGKNAWNFVN